MKKQKSFFGVAVLAVISFLTQTALTQTTPSFEGTWFGTIVITSVDGKIRHDNAVVVIDQAEPTVHGSMGRTVDQLTPWADGRLVENKLTFHLDAGGGLDFSLGFAEGHLAGTAAGSGMQARVELKPAPGLMPHEQLLKEIISADSQLYASFGNCDVAGYARFLSKDLEFYQDHTGETGYEQNLEALRNRCAEGIHLRRELSADSLVVNAAPGFGAIQAGMQRFYSRSQDEQEHLDATARFTNVWSKQSGTWKLVRVISYDHR